MKRRLCSAVLTLFALALFASHVGAATLDVVPAYPDTAEVLVLHLDNPDSLLARIENSYFFRNMATLAPELALASEVMKNASVTDITVAAKFEGDAQAVSGAVQFKEDKQGILDKLAAGGTIDAAEIDALLGFPTDGGVTLKHQDGTVYAIEGGMLPPLVVSPEGGMLLFGATRDDLDQARSALADGTKRLTVQRALPQKSYFYFRDSGTVADEIVKESRGSLRASGEKLFFEAALDPADDGYHLSVFTNAARVFSENQEKPASTGTRQAAPSADKPWLAAASVLSNMANAVSGADGQKATPLTKDERLLMGSGTPWFSLVGRTMLQKSTLQAIRDAVAAGDEDMRDIVQALDVAKSYGIDDDAIVSILKSVGMVLGGFTSVGGNPLQGGYIHVSGEKKDIDLLAPIIEKATTASGFPFQSVAEPGWTVLYTLNEPVGCVVGIKDNTAVLGLLNPDAPRSVPTLASRMANLYEKEDLLMFLNLDGKEFRKMVIGLLDPDGIWGAMVAGEMGSDMPALVEGLKCLAELDALEIRATSMDRLDLSLYTMNPDQQELDKLTTIGQKWAASQGN